MMVTRNQTSPATLFSNQSSHRSVSSLARWLAVFLVATLLGSPVLGQDVGDEPAAEEPAGATDKVSDEERKLIDALLASKTWTHRVFCLMRMERYPAKEVKAWVDKAMEDEDWHVRCFALRTAVRLGIEVPASILEKEREPRVIRAAVRLGIDPGEKVVVALFRREIRTRSFDRLFVAIELGAKTTNASSRKIAAAKIAQVIGAMDSTLSVLAGERIARVLGLTSPPEDEKKWKEWLEEQGGEVKLPEPKDNTAAILAEPKPWVATLSFEKLNDLFNYLGDLQKKDIDVAIVIDATGSMGSVIRRCQSEVDRLVLILNDLSHKMRLGVVAYRDTTDQEGVMELHKLTGYINEVRAFLFKLTAKGGGDFPESVLSGLQGTSKLGWSRKADKEVIIVGDAPSHEKDAEKIKELLYLFSKSDIKVHSVVISGSADTTKSFESIAKQGNGRSVKLTTITDLAKVILQLSLDERAKKAVEDFYDRYVSLCM